MIIGQAAALLLLLMIATFIVAWMTDESFWATLRRMLIVFAVLVLLAFLNKLPDLLTAGALR